MRKRHVSWLLLLIPVIFWGVAGRGDAEGSRLDAPLLQAASAGDADRVTRLLDRGASVNATSAPRGPYRDTPLTLAVLNGRVAIVQRLLARGADIETRVYGDQTPLTLAARYRLPEVVRTLLAKGANPNPPVNGGLTPLMLAALNDDTASVKMLIRAHADSMAVTPFDETARRLAKASKHPDVVQILRQAGAQH